MKLRSLVPALGLLAATTATATAAESGGITIGGFVDVILDIDDDTDELNSSGPQAPIDWGFGVDIELQITYKIGEAVTAQIDIEHNNGSSSDTDLEQAYINWALNDQFSLTAGKYTTYAGWVAADAPDLYRIHGGPITSLYGSDLIGLAGNYAFSDTVSGSLFLVNGLSDRSNANPAANDFLGIRHLGIAADVIFTIADVGSINVEAGYDYLDNGTAASDNDSAEISAAINATIKPKSVEGLTLGAELYHRSAGDYNANTSTLVAGTDSSALGFLLMGNFAFAENMSGTLMIQNVMNTVDVSGTETEQTQMEIALALLTTPTGDSNFAVNYELFFMTDETETGGTSTAETQTIGAAVEFLAIIP